MYVNLNYFICVYFNEIGVSSKKMTITPEHVGDN